MSEQATVTKKQNGVVAPFTIEFGQSNSNGDIVLNVFRETYRGTYSLVHERGRMISRAKQSFALMPDIPGIRFRIDTRNKTVMIYDPLEKDDNLRERIERIMKECGWMDRHSDLRAVPSSTRQCNDDELKTLVWEIGEKIKSDLCRVTQGEFPTPEQIDALPGRLLFDPWNNSPRKPKYQDQVEQWQRELDARG